MIPQKWSSPAMIREESTAKSHSTPIYTHIFYILANEFLTKISNRQETAPYMGIDDVPDYNEGLMMVEFLDSFGNIPPINPGISSVPQNNAVGLQDREVFALL